MITILPTDSSITIDGRIEESAWNDAATADDFQMNMPFDSLPASSPTKVYLTYNDQFLYIAAKCYSPPGKEFVIQSLKRDFAFRKNESFLVFIDAFSDGNSSIALGVNSHGVQLDAIIPRGGTKNISLSWDEKWYAEVVRNATQGYWTVEMAIPLKSLRFKVNSKKWNINFARIDLANNEHSSWNPVPRGFNLYTLSELGQMNWEAPLLKPKHNIALIPYLATGVNFDYQQSDPQVDIKPRIGLDAKISLSSSLNLDLTINPDFSQVEVDDEVINLNRFEISFPEKRILFLENSDLFSSLGNSRVRPFFSRRIGSYEKQAVPILFGARLSGKLNNNWRLGLMSVQTAAVKNFNLKSQNYLVAALEGKVFSNSSISAFVTNRQSFEENKIERNDQNRIGGVEFNFRSRDSKFDGKAFVHSNLQKTDGANAITYAGKLRYKTRTISLFLGMDKVGKNYQADMGFVPRLYHENIAEDSIYRITYVQFRANGYYRFYPKQKNSIVEFYGPSFRSNLFTGDHLEYQEHDINLGFFVQFLNSSKLEFILKEFSPRLFFPFQLSGMLVPFKAGNYPNKAIRAEFKSDKRKFLSGMFALEYGGEYEGKLFNIEGELSLRKQPWGVFTFNFSHQNLSDFPEIYGSPVYTLLGSKMEFSFSRNLFFTTYLQYNTQKNNLNINSRFQWRFRPMSDIFLVYTENYQPTNLSIKNRGLILKLNYWFNP